MNTTHHKSKLVHVSWLKVLGTLTTEDRRGAFIAGCHGGVPVTGRVEGADIFNRRLTDNIDFRHYCQSPGSPDGRNKERTFNRKIFQDGQDGVMSPPLKIVKLYELLICTS